jgi:REP element-mobilizing transposase RayT
MPYNPTIHHRRSIRLKGYDYSQSGLYFVTICVQNRECLFGKTADGEMVLDNAGKMIEKWCAELPNKFSDIMLDEFVIMPNHFHAIIINTGIGGGDVWADLRVCPDDANNVCPDESNKHNNNISGERNVSGEHNILGEHAGSPLHRVVQWFKTMTTNEYIRGVKTLNWQPFNKKLWQRNYWEHIIRNDESYQRIANYIINNPAHWEDDKFYFQG